MFIIRVKTETPKIFVFQTLDGINTAERYIQYTGVPYFIAEVETEDATHGRMIRSNKGRKRWNGEPCNKLSYSKKQRPYCDYEWFHLGTEEECLEESSETNAEATCWASVHSHVEHICGPLWCVAFVDPYKD